MINITGLAIGLTGFTCIMLYVEHELSFDQFHARHADIYRVVKDFVDPDGSALPDATTPPALAKALRTELTDVETATRMAPNLGRLYLLQYGEKKFYETELIRVDQQFFDVFDFPFVLGANGMLWTKFIRSSSRNLLPGNISVTKTLWEKSFA